MEGIWKENVPDRGVSIYEDFQGWKMHWFFEALVKQFKKSRVAET